MKLNTFSTLIWTLEGWIAVVVNLLVVSWVKFYSNIMTKSLASGNVTETQDADFVSLTKILGHCMS